MSRKNHLNLKKQPIWVSVVILILIVCVSISNYVKDNAHVSVSDGEILVHTVDVGQGDCTIITSTVGNIIIDAGTSDSEDSLKKYIKEQGITEFEYAIFTHPHEDHIGGADMVVNSFKVNNIIMPNAVTDSSTYDKLLSAIENSDANVIEATSGNSFSVSEIKFTILAPNSDSYSSLNNYSVVVRMDYGSTSFMFTGDAEAESEKEMLSKYPVSTFNCDVLSVGHHGSSTSSSKDFISAVSPDVALISCGKDNSYGHPHHETIEKLNGIGATILRTDELGNIILKSDGNNIETLK